MSTVEMSTVWMSSTGQIRTARQPARCHAMCTPVYAKCAPGTMYAHRLWIRLWTTLGHAEENRSQPGGNAVVKRSCLLAAHRPADSRTRAGHRHCARARGALAGRTLVIPGIHRPYDDYQFCNRRQIQVQAGMRRSGSTPSSRRQARTR